jgi:inorganic pyrophosphatase
LYHKISISCFDTPNFTYNKIKDLNDLKKYTRDELINLKLPYPELVTPLWVLERTIDW